MLALHQALQALRRGECEAAVVAGCNLCLKPATTLQFQKLGKEDDDVKEVVEVTRSAVFIFFII